MGIKTSSVVYLGQAKPGAGGGSVDYNRVIEKSATIPEASSSTAGKVYMYTGTTDATYTHGYIYECKPLYEQTAVTFSSENITWALNDFLAWLYQAGVPYNKVNHGTMIYMVDADLWAVTGIDATGKAIFTWKEYTGDLENAGCIFIEPPQEGDSSTFTFTTTNDGYYWDRIDVQPGDAQPIVDLNDMGYYANATSLRNAHPIGHAGNFATVGDTDTIWVWDIQSHDWVNTNEKFYLGYFATEMALRSTYPTAAAGNYAVVGSTKSVWVWDASDQDWTNSVDTNNLGYYETQAALEAAHPTAEPGNFAIVSTTDTVWIWDDNNSEWVDSGTQGSVQSVNGKIGAVVLDALDVDATPQLAVMPTASEPYLNRIVQFIGESMDYDMGYFYQCLSDVDTPASATISQTAGSSLSDIEVDVDTFIMGMQPTGDMTAVFTFDGSDWSYDGNTVDLNDYGITFTGTPVEDDVLTVGFTAETMMYYWERKDVQPLGAQETVVVEEMRTDVQLTLDTNTIYNCSNAMDAIEIAFPLLDEVTYISQLNFTSGSAATSFTSPSTMFWHGSDVTTTFEPVEDKRYSIMFYFDGVNYHGIVQAAE